MGKIMIDGQDFSGTYLGAYPESKDQIYDTSDSLNIIEDNVQGAIDTLDAKIGNTHLLDSIGDGTISGILHEAHAVARGANHAMAFDTVADLQAWLKDEVNKNTRNIGDNLLIKEPDVPDYWISKILEEVDPVTGYYYEICQLEIGKIDLTPYDQAIARLDTEMEQCFQSVSDGKALVADAITGKGVPTAANAEFATLAANIDAIINFPPLQSKSTNLDISTPDVTFVPDDGYYGLSDAYVSIKPQAKTVVLSTSAAQTIRPDDGCVLSSVSVPAIALQAKTSKLSTATTSVTLKPDTGYNGLSQAVVSISTQAKSVILSTSSAQTITPDSGYVLSSVSVPAIALQAKTATLNTSTTSVTLKPDTGYNGLSQAVVSISTQAKSVTLSTSASQTITPDSGRVLSSVTVPAVSLQAKSSTLNTGSTSVTLKPDTGYNGLSQATVSISTQTKSVTLSASAQTITPDSGRVLSSVSVPGVATQTKTATLNTSTTSVALKPDSGYWGLSQATVSISTQAKSAALSTSAQTITPDSGRVLSSVSVPAVTGNAGAWCVLSGYTFNSASAGIARTGTMANRAGTTVAASAVSSDSTYTYLSVPSAGYYDTNSKVRTANSNIKNDSVLSTSFGDNCTSLGSNSNSSQSRGIFTVENGSYYAIASHGPNCGATLSGGTVICSATCRGNLNSNSHPGCTLFICRATSTTLIIQTSWGGGVCMKLNIPNINPAYATMTNVDTRSGNRPIYTDITMGNIYVVAINGGGTNQTTNMVYGGLLAKSVYGWSVLNETGSTTALCLLRATTAAFYGHASWGAMCIANLGRDF